MPRETEEEMFRRVQSEARREARLEQQRALERRRQRKLERRKRREEEVRLRYEQAAHRSLGGAPSTRAKGRAIMAKPKKKLLKSCYAVMKSADEDTTLKTPESQSPDPHTLPRRDIATATDPAVTKYPTRPKGTGIAVLPEIKSEDNAPSADGAQDCPSMSGIPLGEKQCATDFYRAVNRADIAMPEWQRVWYRLAMEELQNDGEDTVGRIDATAQRQCVAEYEGLEPGL